MSEVSADEKPTKDQINNDEQFDNWMHQYETRMAQKMAKYTRK